MRIALAAPSAIPARRANTLQVMKMAQALVALGHEVRLAAPRMSNGTQTESLQAVPWKDLARHYGLVEYFLVEWLASSPSLRRYDYGWRAVRWARGWGADLLYTRLPQAAAFGSLGGLATILEVHDLPQGRAGRLLFRAFLGGKGARRLVVITRSLADDLAQALKAPGSGPFTLVAPDGVDLTRYTSLPAPEQARSTIPVLQGKGFTAGYTGHLYAGRGVELILDLAGRLPEVTFFLVGGEPQDVDRLRQVVEDYGLQNVLLAGFVPNAVLPAYQAACEVLLMPYQRRVAASSGGDISRYLSPMKLFEYLASGRAILSSDLPVLREVLSPENAVLLPPEDVDAWAAALHSLCRDPERRQALGAAAKRHAAGYTWEARAARILEGIEDRV